MELASATEGARVLMSTSFDVRRPPERIFENEKGYFITTGGFPQEIVIQLGKTSTIRSIDLVSIGVGKIELAGYESPNSDGLQNPLNLSPSDWNVFSSAKAQDTDPGEFQRLSLVVPQAPKVRATLLKVTILSGTEAFVVVRSMSILGNKVK
jgi:hypothetical protein